ncbi:MAG: hypothetical protein JWP48_2128 [Actinoallomurus sp.]|jgi:hypothetical protein|nr:hypothetical protein [Actinoallomurus sp.]
MTVGARATWKSAHHAGPSTAVVDRNLRGWRRVRNAGQPVGAEYCVTSCDLGVFVEEAAESVSSGDLDVGVDRIG